MDIVCKLLKETPEEIFPEFLKNKEFLKLNKTITINKDIDLNQLLETRKEPAYLPDYLEQELNAKDLRERVIKIINTLTYREKTILNARFGLYGEFEGKPTTLQAIGNRFVITKERVRHIEAKAIRKLQYPDNTRQLEGFLNGVA